MMPHTKNPHRISIYEEHEGYCVARHILFELATGPKRGMRANVLGNQVGDDFCSGSRMGAWLRSMQDKGYVKRVPDSPGSSRARWVITPEGTKYMKS
jgi:DNA-binding MarR family transcriptional regulator